MFCFDCGAPLRINCVDDMCHGAGECFHDPDAYLPCEECADLEDADDGPLTANG